MATRIQITCYDKLVAEAVVENFAEADKLWSAYACLKYKRNKPIGGAIMSDESRRHFNVEVGGVICQNLESIT